MKKVMIAFGTRSEGVEEGILQLVGTEEENIYNHFKLLLENQEEYHKMCSSSNSYGDGLASSRIADIIEKELYKI